MTTDSSPADPLGALFIGADLDGRPDVEPAAAETRAEPSADAATERRASDHPLDPAPVSTLGSS